jgi:hypothetical protein
MKKAMKKKPRFGQTDDNDDVEVDLKPDESGELVVKSENQNKTTPNQDSLQGLTASFAMEETYKMI